MKRKLIVSMIVTAVFLIAGGLGADDEPKRVMSFIAVMNLKCDQGIEKNACTALTDIVIHELVKIGKYKVIDRANRDKILGEVGFQQTGCVEGSCTVEAGRILGVGKIVVGSITKLGETYLVNLQLVNVETAQVEIGVDQRCKNCEIDDLIDSVKNAAQKLMGAKITSPSIPAPVVEGIKGTFVAKATCFEMDKKFNCTKGEIAIWDVATGEKVKSRTIDYIVTSIAFSPDSKYLAIGKSFEKCNPFNMALCKKGEVFLWDFQNDKINNLSFFNGAIVSLAFSSDSSLLAIATGLKDKTITIWDLKNNSEFKTIRNAFARQVRFTPDNNYLFAKGDVFSMMGNLLEMKLTKYDINTGQEKIAFPKKASGYCIAVSPNGKILASGGLNPDIRIWNAITGKEERTVKGHKKNVVSLSFSPDGRMLASGSSDRTIKVWATESYSEVKSLEIPYKVASWVSFSPDGKYLIAAGVGKPLTAGGIIIWDVGNWTMKKNIPWSNHLISFQESFSATTLQ